MAATGSGERAGDPQILLRTAGLGEPPLESTLNNVTTTTFVPHTTHDVSASSYNFTTSAPATTPSYTFGDLREATKPVLAADRAQQDALPGSTSFYPAESSVATTTLAAPEPPRDSNILTIVGATCGVVGLLLGIIITAAVWMYVQKRRTGRRPYRHASVVEKNPKEKTFEPLDLTLTLPSYGHGDGPPQDRHASLSGSARTLESTPKRHTPPAPNPGSYHSYDEPTPPLPGEGRAFDRDFVGAFGRPREMISIASDYGYINDRFCAHEDFSGSFSDVSAPHRRSDRFHKSRNSSKEHAVRLSSITTRDSFSSGLGTGTESDTLPYETRASRFSFNRGRDEQQPHHHTRRPRDLSGHFGQLQHQNVARSQDATPTRVGELGIVREDSARRSKRSAAGGSRRRVARVSDASSSYAPSVNGWSTDGSSYSPASTLPPQAETDAVFAPPRSPNAIAEEDASNLTDRDPVPPSRGDSPGSGVHGDDERQLDEEEEEEDIVSTYFDMHFPPTPLRSNTLSPKGSLRECKKPAPLEERSSQVAEEARYPATFTRRNSDVTIEL